MTNDELVKHLSHFPKDSEVFIAVDEEVSEVREIARVIQEGSDFAKIFYLPTKKTYVVIVPWK